MRKTKRIQRTSPKNDLKESLSNQKGQTFLEFILLLMILITLSFGFMAGFNRYVGTKWNAYLKIIAKPNSATVTIP
jgi:hypothetical protein